MNILLGIFKSTLAHKGSMALVLIMPGIVEIIQPDTNVLSYITMIFPMFIGVSMFRFAQDMKTKNETN
ncbi:MAG: hypothetical protein ACI4XL_12395 [Bacillus sp. (in: firmicutes)]